MIYCTHLLYSAKNTSDIRSDLGVKIHGSIMNIIDHKYAQQLHNTTYQPFSVSALREGDVIRVRVCGLDRRAEEICTALSQERELTIYGMDRPLVLFSSVNEPPKTLEQAVSELPEGSVRFIIDTPAMVKLGGVPSCPMDISRYFHSVAAKLAQFEGVKLSPQEAVDVVSQLKNGAFSLHSAHYNMGGTRYLGLMGEVELLLPKTPQEAMMVRTLLAYAQYCGIGAKTALGMGAVRIKSSGA